MSLDGGRLRYEDENGKTVVLAAKGRTFQVGSYYNCDLILEGPEEERLICEINCDAFGRVIIYNKSSGDPIHLNDVAIHASGKRPLLHGGKITIREKVYTWEFPKCSEVQEAPCTPERLLPKEQASNSCPSLKQSHRLQAEKRLTVHNFHYSINSDDEGNTSIESRDQSESHLEDVSLNESIQHSTEKTAYESPKVNLLEATQNKENTATPPGSHQKLLKLCAISDVVITSYSPRETGVKTEKSFSCVRKPGYTTTSLAVSTPKSIYSTPKGNVLSELNEDSCSRDLMDFSTPSTSKKTKRDSSMFLIDLTTPSKLRQTPKHSHASKLTPKQTPISVDSTDESSDASPLVIDITNSDTPPSPSPSQRYKTPQRPAGITTPNRTPHSLMKRAMLTSIKKQIAANQPDKNTPIATPKRTSLLEARRHCLTTPRRLPFHPHRRTPVQREGHTSGNAPKTSPRKRMSLMESPRENKVSQLRKSFAAAKRSPGVDKSNKLVAKARRSLNSPKSGSPKPGSSKPSSPCQKKTIDVSQIKSSTPEKPDDSQDELSRTFTIMHDTQGKDQSGAAMAIEAVTVLIPGEVDDDVSFQLSSLIEKRLPSVSSEEPTPIRDKVEPIGTESDVEGKLKSAQEDVNPKPDAAVLDENECDKHEFETGKNEDECKEKDELPVGKQLENAIIEDSICEEVHANIPQQTKNSNSEKIIEESICEELPLESTTGNSNSTGGTSQKENQPSPNAETPVVRRSLRRHSVEQRVASTTPRRSTRRSSMEASSKTLPEKDNKRSRRASCSAMDSQGAVTPRRKRRFTQEMSTPTRQSLRILNTPKRELQMDESVGDMGVILEEVGSEDDSKSVIADDENYGNELPVDDIDKVDFHGLRDLLKTPKSCSTPRFKGLRELMRTPKIPASPIIGNMAELLETSVGRTPFHDRRSTAVSRMEQEKPLENALKTPSARNIMVPNEPASAVLKSRKDSLAAATEYDLNVTNNTLHLDKIFEDVPETTGANMEDTEEINVTAISTATGVDPLDSINQNKTVASEALMNVGHTATASASPKDPLTSTTYKATMHANPNLSAFADCGFRSISPNTNEMSGIQLLDQTSDSMFSEALVVSGVESCEVTVDETRPLGQTNPPIDNIEDRSDTDSNVGLTEPLVFSDDEEEPKKSEPTPKQSDGSQELSIAYKLEESVNLTEHNTVDENSRKVETGAISEISLIEVEDTTIEGSTCDQNLEGGKLQEEKSLDIPSVNSDENIESAVVELTIVESEIFPLDTTADSSINSTNVIDSSVEETIPDQNLEGDKLQEEKSLDIPPVNSDENIESVGVELTILESEIFPLDTTADSSINSTNLLDSSVGKTIPDQNLEGDKLQEEKSLDIPPVNTDENIESAMVELTILESEIFSLDTTADSSINSTNVLDCSVEKTIPDHNLNQEDAKSTNDAQDTSVTDEKSSTDLFRSVGEVSPSNKSEVHTDEPPIIISPSKELAKEAKSGDEPTDKDTSKPSIERSEELFDKQPLHESHSDELVKETNSNEVSIDGEVIQPAIETLPFMEQKQEPDVSTDAESNQHFIESSPLKELSEETQPQKVHSLDNTKQEVNPYPVKDVLKETKTDESIQPVTNIYPTEELQEEAKPDESPTEIVQGSNETKTDTIKPIIETSTEKEPPVEAHPNELPSSSEKDQVIVEKPSDETRTIIESSGDELLSEAGTDEVPDLSKIDQLITEKSPAEEPTEKAKPDETQEVVETSPGEKDPMEASTKEDPSVSKMDNVVVETNPQTDEPIPSDEIKNCGPVDMCIDEVPLSNSSAAFEIEHSKKVAMTSLDLDTSDISKEKGNMEALQNDVACVKQSSIASDLANLSSLEVSTNLSPNTRLCGTSMSQDESAQIDEQNENDYVEEHVAMEASSNEIIAAHKESDEKFEENIPDDALSVVEQSLHDENALIHQSLTDQNKEVSIIEESEAVVSEEPKESQPNQDFKTEVIQLDASIIVEQDTLDEGTSVGEDKDQSTEMSMLKEQTNADQIIDVNSMDKKESTDCNPKKDSDDKDNDDEVIQLDASSLDESYTEPSVLVEKHSDMELNTKETEKCNQNQSDDEVISLDSSGIAEQCPLKEDSLIEDPNDDSIIEGIVIEDNDVKECVSEESSNQNEVTEPANHISIITEEPSEKEICPKISTVNAAISSPHQVESQKMYEQINQVETLIGCNTSVPAVIINSSSPNGELLNASSERDIELPIPKVEDVSDAMPDFPCAQDGGEIEKVDIMSEDIAKDQQPQPGDPASSSSTGHEPESTVPHDDAVDKIEPAPFNSTNSSVVPSENEPQEVVSIKESADFTKSREGGDATDNIQEKCNLPSERDQEQEDGTHIKPVSEDKSLTKTESNSAVDSDQEMLAVKDDARCSQEKPSEKSIHSTSKDSKSKDRTDIIVSRLTISPEPTEMSGLISKPSKQEEKLTHEDASKPVKRVTRKGSASADSATEVERPKRVTRKPSAEVLEIEDHGSDTKQEDDLSIKSRGRARKPSSDVNEDKTEAITEKRGRVRTPSVEVSETTANVEQKEIADHKSDEALKPILEEEPEPEVEKRIKSNAEQAIIIDKPKKRLRKASSKESDTPLDNKEKINTDLEVANEPGSTHSNYSEQRDVPEPFVSTTKSEVEGDLEGKIEVHETNQKQTTKERPKRRGRKASANETDDASEKIEKAEDHLKAINKDGKLAVVLPTTSNEIENTNTEIVADLELKPKRRVRKASAKETNTTSDKKEKTLDILAPVIEVEPSLSSKENSDHSDSKGPAPVATLNISKEEQDPDNVSNVSSENRAPKESKKQEDVSKETGKTRAERPKRRLRKASEDIVNEANDAHNPETEEALASVQEDHLNLADQELPKKRARKSAEFMVANVEEHTKEEHVERPKRRGRKPSQDIDHVSQDVLEKPKRRGKTPADRETHPLGDEKQEPSLPVVEPAKKTRRNARKASAETVEAVSTSGEEHLAQIREEATEPVTESEPAPTELLPDEGEVNKTQRRGRKPTLDTDEGIKKTPPEDPAPLPSHSRRRGRKATEDEALPTADLAVPKTKLRGRRASMEPEHKDELPAESSSDVVELPAAKTTRRGRKPSVDMKATTPEKKPPSRRVRKASASVDEEQPVAKKTAIRRGRKNEAQDEEREQIDLQDLPTEIASALVDTSGSPLKASDAEELTPRRREGRNLPRKNYEEAPDDEKPHSGLRRARKPPAASKALANKASEPDPVTPLPVTNQPPVKADDTPDNAASLPEPTTSQRREGRNLPRKNYTEDLDDEKPTPARSRRVRNLTAKALELIVDSSPRPATPKRPKGKAANSEEPPAKKATPEIPSTTEASGPEHEPIPATKGRGTRRKADDSDLEKPDVKTAKKTVRGAGGKTKAETETEKQPPIKKPRGGARAKTPSEEAPQEEEQAKKPAPRSRAKSAKAVEPEQPAEEPQVEAPPGSSTSTAAVRGGRGRKVHFETAPETSAVEGAPQRATRSRRK
ncbi:titin isoform X2 [Drosophila mauritiana]|uniref:Titin isoform X2 n=1 Tax=Drosophila mauritiana TaxID=7226 RepID=A0A6P8KDE3_DROMA|nr:titin isoform X2 [Drosophila mauritiana]